MNSKKKARIINTCIENILNGVVPKEQCFLKYPELVGEIQSMLSLADRISSITFDYERDVNPRLQKVNLLQKLPDREEFVTKRIDSRYRLQNLKWRFSMAWVMIITTVLSLISGAGAVYASNDALPGDVLYPVKMWTEDFQLAIAPVDMDLVLNYQFANTRIEEAAQLIQEGRFEDLDTLVVAYQQRAELMTREMARIQAEDPDEAVMLRLDLEEKLQEQARIMQSYTMDTGESEEIKNRLREQISLMLETNTQLRLQITKSEDVPEDLAEGLDTSVDTTADETATKASEIKSPSMNANDETGSLIFGLGGKGENGVYADINGSRYDCAVEGDTAYCSVQGAPQKGGVNLYDPQTNQLLYSYSYEFGYAYGNKFESENKNENSNAQDTNGEKGAELNKADNMKNGEKAGGEGDQGSTNN